MPIAKDIKDIPDKSIQGTFPAAPYPPVAMVSRLKYVLPKKVADFFTDNLLARAQEYTLRPYRYDSMGETGVSGIMAESGATLNTIADEFYFKAITGQVDIDAEWDAYVAKWKSAGGEKLTAEYQKATIVSEFMKGKIVY